MKRQILFTLLCQALLTFAALGQSTSAPPVAVVVNNPPSLALKPTVTAVAPSSVVKTLNAVSLVVTGTNFTAASTVNILLPQSIVPLTVAPTAVTPTSLTAVIPAGAIKVDGQIFVSVTNPPVFAPPPPPCIVSANAWKNQSLTVPGANFRVEYDASVTTQTADGLAGVSNGPATAYPAIAAAVRFNQTGTFDARNDAAYTASQSVPYIKGTSYHISLDVNLTAHTYTATVAGKVIGTGLAFRTEQKTVAALNNLAVMADVDSISVCNVVVTPLGAPPPPVLHSVSLSWNPQTGMTYNVYRSLVSGAGYLKLNSAGLTAPSMVDPSVANGSKYFYVVTSANGTNESTFSAEVSATIPN